MKHIFKTWFIIILMLFGRTPAWGEPLKPLEPSSFPSLISSVRISAPLDFCDEPVPLENHEVRERLEKELMLTLWDRPQVILWIKRSNRYLSHIEKVLQKNHMPDDLKYVAIAESALRPHVGSRKGAIGFWQFIRSTGKRYGLIINNRIDQRRNIFTSTMAAVRYFKELYAMFGSWTLSAAAYNMGEGGLQSEILAQKNDEYYNLYLPLETQRYIFRIISAKLILTNPEKYGFRFTGKDVYPPLSFDRIKLEFSQKTPIAIVAQAAKTTFKVIKDLNPEIRGHHISIGNHSILIPKGSSKGFNARYKKLLSQWTNKNKRHVYVVQKGDSLSSIAQQFDVPLQALAIWNHLNISKHIHPGDRLIIYPKNTPMDRNLN